MVLVPHVVGMIAIICQHDGLARLVVLLQSELVSKKMMAEKLLRHIILSHSGSQSATILHDEEFLFSSR